MNHLNKNILPRKEEWAISVRIRKKLCTHNVDTTNYVEVSFRITKDNQFNRVKAYNLADLLDIVLDNSIYYVQRCIDIGNNRISQLRHQRSRYLSKKCNIDRNRIVVLHNGLPNSYLVPSERIEWKMYEVNMDFSVCQLHGGHLYQNPKYQDKSRQIKTKIGKKSRQNLYFIINELNRSLWELWDNWVPCK